MRYLVGPWQWKTENGMSFWAPPDGFSGLDLRPLAQQAAIGGTPGFGLFAGDGNPGSDYEMLGIGHWNDIKSTQRMKDAIPGKPDGDDLLGLILHLFTVGADPDGIAGPRPLMPSRRMRLEICLGGRSHFEQFRWGDRNSGKIKMLLRRDFAATMAAAQAGQLKDTSHHLRVLDALCEKYGVADWKEFVPDKLQKDVPGRLKHETTITESFNKADSDILGPDLTWTEQNDIDVVSNRASWSSGNPAWAWASTDLSTDDHYSQATVVTQGTNVGTVTRVNSSTDFYLGRVTNTPDGELWKRVAGGFTQLINGASASVTANDVLKTSIDGSTLTLYKNGSSVTSTTDTALTGYLKCGIQLQGSGAVVDSFEAGDVTAAGLLYTQLERGTRGLNRGMYTKWG